MSALREFQTAFKAYLTGPDDNVSNVAPRSVSAGFTGNASIHRNNVRHAHVGALAANYPAIRALVGERYFDGLAAQFTSAHPPASAIHASYGAGFGDYLSGRSELSSIPFLADVARLEWAMNEAFHARASSSLSPGAAAALFTGGVRDLDLISSARLLALDHPALEIRTAALAGDEDGLAALAATDQRLVVFRAAGTVAAETLSPGGFALLSGLAAGRTLDRAVTLAFGAEPEFSAAEALARLLHLGVFCAPSSPKQGN